jgi:hypothetical protein
MMVIEIQPIRDGKIAIWRSGYIDAREFFGIAGQRSRQLGLFAGA